MTEPDLFAGTAEHYARYRPPYPAELLDSLRREAGPGAGDGLLVDLACGTGEIAIPLSPAFREVSAVDQQPEMVQLGREKARSLGVTNIRWQIGRAEEVAVPAGAAALVSIGAAFHWMDRPLVAERARSWLAPGRCIAVAGSNSPWTGTSPWQPVVLDVIRKWLGAERRAGSGTFTRPSAPHEEILAAAGFDDVEERVFWTPYRWTLDTFLGYLRSTSFSGRRVLGEVADDFEADLRRALLAYDASGVYEETIKFYYILGRRPG